MPTFHNIEPTSEFPDYIQENVSLHKPYFDFLKNNENQYNFFQWCVYNYENSHLELTKEDFTLILQHTDCQRLDIDGYNSLSIALIYGQTQTVPLTTEHFTTLLHGSNFVVRADRLIDNNIGLLPLFVLSPKTVFTPTSEEISTILENVAQKSKAQTDSFIGSWNALHFALYYGKMGQTPLEEKHFDYLFENFEYDLSKLSLYGDAENIISKSKTEYEIRKEKNLIDSSLEKNDKSSLKPIKI